MRVGKRLIAIVAALCAVALLAVPALASAAKSVYHPKSESRNFGKGDGNWTGTSSSEGTCVATLTCPEVINSYESSGGAAGPADGYLRTTIGSLAGVQSTSTGVYTSPAFRYEGVQGKKASKLSFSLSRRSSLAPFLDVQGNEATYSVALVDTKSGRTLNIVEQGSLADTDGNWITADPVSLKSSKLRRGHRYRMRITSEFVSGATVVPGGSADYDNVRLVARGINAKGGSGSGGPGAGQVGGGIKPVKVIRHGRYMKVPYKCPKFVKPGACDAKLSVSLTRKGKKVTQDRTIRVRPGHSRKTELKIKRGFKAKVAQRQKVFVHARVRAKHHVYHVTRKVKIKH